MSEKTIIEVPPSNRTEKRPLAPGESANAPTKTDSTPTESETKGVSERIDEPRYTTPGNAPIWPIIRVYGCPTCHMEIELTHSGFGFDGGVCMDCDDELEYVRGDSVRTHARGSMRQHVTVLDVEETPRLFAKSYKAEWALGPEDDDPGLGGGR